METTITYSTTLSTITCGNCAIPFAIPASLLQSKKNDGSVFYCPNGCNISYSQTENDRLKKQLAREQHLREQAETEASVQRLNREHAERCTAAARGRVTRIKNRVGNGVCPCCNRFFESLHRHIQRQHPEFKTDES